MLKDKFIIEYEQFEDIIIQSIINHRSKIITGTIFYTYFL